jgi:hypothetical protein
MNRLDKAVLSYITTTSNLNDVDLRIEEYDGAKWIIAYIDWSKLDKNGPNYNPEYREKITMESRRKNAMGFVFSSKTFLESAHNEAKKFFGEDIKYHLAFIPKNYDYIKSIEKTIQEKTKLIDPEAEIGFTNDQDRATPILRVSTKEYNSTPNYFKEFFDELQSELEGQIDLSSYTRSMGRLS